ncbi:potassium channel family protein [Luteimicrobium sp. NPDC057192]|uniref:potassium channel family protein n=1 Tax=Luteimicrobium sp. NPDC057192 TaxID=3346042 RepID=UPI00364587D3
MTPDGARSPAPAARRGPWHAVRRLVRRADDFVVVLVLLLTTYVLYSASGHVAVQAVVTGLYVLTFLVAFQASDPTHRQKVAMAVTFAAAVVAVGLSAWLLPHGDARGVANAFVAAMLVVTLVAVLQRVLHHPRVTVQSIAGALSAYLLVGMTFSAVYAVVAWFGPHPFFAGGGHEDARSFQYFSFTTLTTTGYGDLAPSSPAGRSLANIEALTGQIFLATLVASLVASYGLRAWRQPPAPPDDAPPEGPDTVP